MKLNIKNNMTTNNNQYDCDDDNPLNDNLEHKNKKEVEEKEADEDEEESSD